jgi:6-phosphofructo-2-kinase/fructose-2,6-biphosphatase 2
MLKWFKGQNNLIAILDATNSTKSRRRWIKDVCDAEGVETLFVESKCDDEDVIMSNIRQRITMYERVYETLDEDESDMTYCKIIDVGSQVIINRIHDYLQSRVVYYLMNLHIKPRSIWISRVCLTLLFLILNCC